MRNQSTRITPETAVKLASILPITAEKILHIQDEYDLWVARQINSGTPCPEALITHNRRNRRDFIRHKNKLTCSMQKLAAHRQALFNSVNLLHTTAT